MQRRAGMPVAACTVLATLLAGCSATKEADASTTIGARPVKAAFAGRDVVTPTGADPGIGDSCLRMRLSGALRGRLVEYAEGPPVLFGPRLQVDVSARVREGCGDGVSAGRAPRGPSEISQVTTVWVTGAEGCDWQIRTDSVASTVARSADCGELRAGVGERQDSAGSGALRVPAAASVQWVGSVDVLPPDVEPAGHGLCFRVETELRWRIAASPEQSAGRLEQDFCFPIT